MPMIAAYMVHPLSVSILVELSCLADVIIHLLQHRPMERGRSYSRFLFQSLVMIPLTTAQQMKISPREMLSVPLRHLFLPFFLQPFASESLSFLFFLLISSFVLVGSPE